MADFNFITFNCVARGITKSYRLGPGGAALGGGVGGITTEVLPGDTDVIIWNSHPIYTQTVDLMLDGLKTRTSVQADLDALYTMARIKGTERYPPLIRLSGNARRPDIGWRINDIAPDESNAKGDGAGALWRIAVVVTLVQDRKPESAIKKSASERRVVVAPSSGRVVVVGTKDTLASIASKYDVSGGAAAIAKANKIRRGAKLKAGQRLRMP